MPDLTDEIRKLSAENLLIERELEEKGKFYPTYGIKLSDTRNWQ